MHSNATNFPLSFVCTASYKFDKLYFHLAQTIFKILLRLPWPTCYLEVFCSTSRLGVFQLSFCYWFFCLISLWSENIFCVINNLLNLLCFMAQTMVYLGECSVSLKRTFILLQLDEVFHKCQLHPVDRWCCSIQLCPYWFSAGWIRQLLVDRYWWIHYYSWRHLFVFAVLLAFASTKH